MQKYNYLPFLIFNKFIHQYFAGNIEKSHFMSVLKVFFTKYKNFEYAKRQKLMAAKI